MKKSVFLNSIFIQALSGLTLFAYYHLITLSLDLNSENVFFIYISITAISILICDFSFAMTHIKLGHTIYETIELSLGLRTLLIVISTVLTMFFWLFNINTFELSFLLIFLILLFQISELIIPYYLFIVTNLGVFGQSLKLIKFVPLVAILFLFELTLTEIIVLNIFLNFLIFIYFIYYFKAYVNINLIKYLLILKADCFTIIKDYGRNFLPNLGGLLISMVIPVFGVHYLNKTNLNALILTDRFVRNFENIFQAVLQWNLRKLKDLTSREIISYAQKFMVVTLLFIAFSPMLISILLNADFDQLNNTYLRVYCTIIFMGPMSTFIGIKYFVYFNRPEEFSLIVGLIGLIAILAIVIPIDHMPIQIILPICYCIALITLIIRRSKRGQ